MLAGAKRKRILKERDRSAIALLSSEAEVERVEASTVGVDGGYGWGMLSSYTEVAEMFSSTREEDVPG